MDNENKQQDPGIDLSRYRDSDGDSMKKISFGLWFLKNRRNFFIGLILFLAAGSLIVYSYFFYNLYDYIRYGAEERRALQELSEVGVVLTPGRLANPIEEIFFQSFFHNNQYDFVAQVKNPNSNFFSNINYCFIDGEVELTCGSSTIFPDEIKHVVALSVKLENRPISPKLIIKSTNWERVDLKKYPDWKSYYSERNNFTVSDVKFEVVQPSDTTLKSTNNLSFNIKNNSPYNYWELPLTIILYSRGTVVGVNKFTVLEFMSLEERLVNIFWANSISSVDRAEVFPDLNILKEVNYIKYK